LKKGKGKREKGFTIYDLRSFSNIGFYDLMEYRTIEQGTRKFEV